MRTAIHTHEGSTNTGMERIVTIRHGRPNIT
jgi:hypothetical protein